MNRFPFEKLKHLKTSMSSGFPDNYPLVIKHSHGKWSIEIDGLPFKNGDFPWRTVSHNQRVPPTFFQLSSIAVTSSGLFFLRSLPGPMPLMRSFLGRWARKSRSWEMLDRCYLKHHETVQLNIICWIGILNIEQRNDLEWFGQLDTPWF